VRQDRQPRAEVHADHPCSLDRDASCNCARPHAVWEGRVVARSPGQAGRSAGRTAGSRPGGARSTPHRWLTWLLALAPRRPSRRRRRPPQARPQLLGHDLDDRACAAVLGGPTPLPEPAHDHDPAAPAQLTSSIQSPRSFRHRRRR
jgi:hypothetical protein